MILLNIIILATLIILVNLLFLVILQDFVFLVSGQSCDFGRYCFFLVGKVIFGNFIILTNRINMVLLVMILVSSI